MSNSQSSIESMNFLELEVLNIHETWIPLQSSHTSSDANSPTNGETKRPSKTEDEVRTDGGDE